MNQSPTGVTSEGVDQWTPPPGFENPVPEPGGPLQRGGCGCLVVVLVVLAAIGVGVALLWPTIEDTKKDVEKLIDDAKEASDISTSGNSETTTGIATDGRSDMPGGGVRLNYKVLPDSSEWTIVRGTAPELIGSEWGMQRDDGDGTSFMRLERLDLGNRFDQSQLDVIRESAPDIAGDGGSAERDGRLRLAGRSRAPDGSRQLSVSYSGPTDTYRFVCNVRPDDTGFWRTCVAADKTLRFSG